MKKRFVKIVEVGPRDGLQNEEKHIDTATKIQFIDKLSDTGLKHIEVSSFVNPNRIPQLADASEVFAGIERKSAIQYSALVPNEKGMKSALSSKVDAIAVFTAVSQSFCQKNINCSVEESLARFEPVITQAKENNLPVRAYVSCVLGCPYEGFISAEQVANLAHELKNMGCEEISLGDTIGAGTPELAKKMLETTAKKVPMEILAVHFHDTRGQALANILACLESGVSIIDASVAGLGGCPYASGASGNVATEDLIYMLHGMGYETGVDLDKLIELSRWISESLQRRNTSRVSIAGIPNEFETYQIKQ